MFVEELQSSLRLLDSDEFLGPLSGDLLAEASLSRRAKGGDGQGVLRFGVRRRRHAGQSVVSAQTARVAG